ncbi:hypothetical protein, partial [Bordetella holmesii]
GSSERRSFTPGLYVGAVLNLGAGHVRTTLAELGDVFRQPQPVDPRPNYIHLSDALFFTTDGEPISLQPTLWRGRLAQVDGFILGKLQPQ